MVSTRTGGFADVVKDDRTGVVVNERSGKELANGVLSLLKKDPVAVGRAGCELALDRFFFHGCGPDTWRSIEWH